MIEGIYIENEATYGPTPEALTDLSKVNFVFGSNGTGKTTISRVIADVTACPECRLALGSGIPRMSLQSRRKDG